MELARPTNIMGARPASQASQAVPKPPRTIRRMGSIRESSSVLSNANYVELRRIKVNWNELRIDRTMQYGQSRLIGWDHVAGVKEDVLPPPPPPPTAWCSFWARMTKVWDHCLVNRSMRPAITAYPCVMCCVVVFIGVTVAGQRPPWSGCL